METDLGLLGVGVAFASVLAIYFYFDAKRFKRAKQKEDEIKKVMEDKQTRAEENAYLQNYILPPDDNERKL